MPQTTGTHVEVPEITLADRVEIDPDRTALLIIDMQNDFVSEGGKLVVPDAAATVPTIARLRDRARRAGVRVFYTQDSHPPGDPEFAIWGEHALEGTQGWRIVDDLKPDAAAGDRVFRKHRYDGFFGTCLNEELRVAGIDTLIICGTVANVCVLHTAASAAIRWYRVILPTDTTSALNDFDLRSAVRQIHFLFRGVITTADALELEPVAAPA
jgi:nicotinamidase-related amidase